MQSDCMGIFSFCKRYFDAGKQVGTAYVGAKDKDAWAAIIDQMLEEVA